MSIYNFKVRLSTSEALSIVKNRQNAELVYEEFHQVDEKRAIGTLIFEKYYMRTSNRAALTVIIDSLKGYTEVRSISTGSSESWLFKFDWGASDDFAHSVKSNLEEYILE